MKEKKPFKVRKNIFRYGLAVGLVLIGGCAQQDIYQARNFLPEKIAEFNSERISDIRVYRSDSLWDYINGGAELYHDYNFIEVATADYKAGAVEIVVDIYRFDSSLNAYGLYTNYRPPTPDTIRLGVEGYKAPGSVNFVKGTYLVRLTGYDESASTSAALTATARAIEKMIPGTTEYPELFRRFYFVDKIKYTDQYLAGSFLGRKFLTAFYTQDFLIENDTATFFLSEDATGEKFDRWMEDLKNDTTFFQLPPGILTVNGRFFVYKDSFYNVILVFYDSGFILGGFDMQMEYMNVMAQWIMSLPGFNADSTMVRINRITDTIDN